MKRIARKNFYPSKNARICSLHFKTEDFVFDSADQQNRRKRKRGTIKLAKTLQDNVYPVFDNLPAYYTYKSNSARLGVASSSSRHKNAAARLEEQCDTFLNADKIENFNDLLEKISKKIHHQEYLLHQTDFGVNLFYLSPQQPLSIKALIFINAELEVIIHQKQQVMPLSSY